MKIFIRLTTYMGEPPEMHVSGIKIVTKQPGSIGLAKEHLITTEPTEIHAGSKIVGTQERGTTLKTSLIKRIGYLLEQWGVLGGSRPGRLRGLNQSLVINPSG